eukprot:GHUV01018165.1.p3 GENE.GHUV01018165.1~~GHUV01018165.1.p3  ORF type:complete len:106 (-),score=12.90 GHUV01018165.1:259-576(-)
MVGCTVRCMINCTECTPSLIQYGCLAGKCGRLHLLEPRPTAVASKRISTMSVCPLAHAICKAAIAAALAAARMDAALQQHNHRQTAAGIQGGTMQGESKVIFAAA